MRYAITFGDAAIIHIGAKELMTDAVKSFSFDDLLNLSREYDDFIFHDLSLSDGEENEKAAVLVMPMGTFISSDMADALLEEQNDVQYDRKYYDFRFKALKNKRARYNVVFGDNAREHNEDYQEHTIIGFDTLPNLSKVRAGLKDMLELPYMPVAEGNMYYQDASGIGYHGDVERSVVMCLSLGDTSTLSYQWRMPHVKDQEIENPPRIDIKVHHGDVYIMSDKAVGRDWMHRSKRRLVHAAGNKKYRKA